MSSRRPDAAVRAWQFLTRHRVPSLLCALAAVWGWSGLVGFESHALDYVVVAAAVIAIYELNRITDRGEDAVNCAREAGLAELHRPRILWTFLLTAAGAQLLALVRTPRWPGLILTGVLILGISYSVPLRRYAPKARLKTVPFVKNLAAAVGWAACVVLYPAFSAKAEASVAIWAAFILMLLGTFVVEVIWDLRDVEGDARGGIRTIPLLVGVRGSRILLQLICLAAAVLVGVSCIAGQLAWKWSLLLVNAGAFATMFALLPDRIWHWRPLSSVVVLLQAGLLLQLGMMTRRL